MQATSAPFACRGVRKAQYGANAKRRALRVQRWKKMLPCCRFFGSWMPPCFTPAWRLQKARGAKQVNPVDTAQFTNDYIISTLSFFCSSSVM